MDKNLQSIDDLKMLILDASVSCPARRLRPIVVKQVIDEAILKAWSKRKI